MNEGPEEFCPCRIADEYGTIPVLHMPKILRGCPATTWRDDVLCSALKRRKRVSTGSGSHTLSRQVKTMLWRKLESLLASNARVVRARIIQQRAALLNDSRFGRFGGQAQGSGDDPVDDTGRTLHCPMGIALSFIPGDGLWMRQDENFQKKTGDETGHRLHLTVSRRTQGQSKGVHWS